MAQQRENLSGLAFVEREMSWLADEAVGRTADERMADALRRVRDQHEQAAVRLAEVLAEAGGQTEVPMRLREEIRILQHQVRHARDEAEVVTGVLDAERADMRLHESVLEAGLPEDAGQVVREHLSIERDHVDMFEDFFPVFASGAQGTPPSAGPPA